MSALSLGERIARVATNAGGANRLRTTLNFYLTGAEWFARHPKVKYCDDGIMAQLYPRWRQFSDTVQASRRTEWNTIRRVAQLDVSLVHHAAEHADTKRDFLRRVTAAKQEVG